MGDPLILAAADVKRLKIALEQTSAFKAILPDTNSPTTDSTARSMATSAAAAAAVADSKAVSDSVVESGNKSIAESNNLSQSILISIAQSTADSVSGGSTDSIARSMATSAALNASVADSKAVSDSVTESGNRSFADSNNTSQSVLISIAYSAAISGPTVPGGLTTEVQLNRSGVLDGSENVTIIGTGTDDVLTLLKNANITNQKTAGTTGEDPSKIATGGPNTIGLRVEGTAFPGAPWDPSVLTSTGVAFWIDADSESYANNDPVSTATDLSGNSRDATGSGAARPTFKTGIFNGATMPGFYFDGGDILATSAFSLTNTGIIAVFLPTTQGMYFEHGTNANSNGTFYLYDTVYSYFRRGTSGGVGISGGAGWLGTSAGIGCGYYDGSNLYLRKDGSAVTSLGDSGGATDSQSLYIGARFGGSLAYTGYIAEAVLINDPTQANIERLEGYLAWKWGLVSLLPGGHPYKSAAPTVDVAQSANLAEFGPDNSTTGLVIGPNGDVTFSDGINVIVGTSTGTQIGTSSSQKLGFWGATPVVRGSAWTISNVTTDRSYDANSTTVDELADALGTLIQELQTKGFLS